VFLSTQYCPCVGCHLISITTLRSVYHDSIGMPLYWHTACSCGSPAMQACCNGSCQLRCDVSFHWHCGSCNNQLLTLVQRRFQLSRWWCYPCYRCADYITSKHHCQLLLVSRSTLTVTATTTLTLGHAHNTPRKQLAAVLENGMRLYMCRASSVALYAVN
jgi:hypothetical protein